MVRRSALLALTAAFVIPATTAAQQHAEKSSVIVEVPAKSVKWAPANIPGLVPGMEMAVISGNPEVEGRPYTMRLRLPAGYAFPAHWHPNDENVTVLSGTFFVAMGAKTDPAALKKYLPGDYLLMPASMPHFGRVEGETVLQLHGIGPFDLKVIEEIPGARK
jgi:quercetin dioxygenase-like cupin family protein